MTGRRPEADAEYCLSLDPQISAGHAQPDTQFDKSRLGAQWIEVRVTLIENEAVIGLYGTIQPVNGPVVFANIRVCFRVD